MRYIIARLTVWPIVFVVCVLLLTGCSGTIHPPVNPPDPTTVYITDYGRHSSLVLPGNDGGYVEWAVGDWNWFALGRTQWYNAIGAIVISPQATLARRFIPHQPDDAALQQALRTAKMIRFDVSQQRAEALLKTLEARYASEKATEIHSTYSNMDHVKDSEFYWGLHNCNHVTASWLRELGARVDGFTILSQFKLAE